MLDDEEIKLIHGLNEANDTDSSLEDLSYLDSTIEHTEEHLQERYRNSLGYTVGLAGLTGLLGAMSVKEFLEGNTDLSAKLFLGSATAAGTTKAYHDYIFSEISETYSQFRDLKE